MGIIDILIIASALFQAFLVVAVFLKSPRSKINQSFTLFGGLLAIWSFLMFFYENPLIGSVELWIKSIYGVGVFMACAGLYFGYCLPPVGTKIPKYIYILHFVIGLINLYLLFYTDLIVKEVQVVSLRSYTKTGVGYYLYSLWAVSVVIHVIYEISLKRKLVKGVERAKLNLMKIGLLFFSAWVMIPDFALPIFFDYPYLFGLSSVGTGIFSAFTAYAILKYRFLGINYIVGKFIYFLIMTSIPLSLFYLISFVQTNLWGSIFTAEALISGVIVAFFFVFLFWKLDGIIRNFLERNLIYADFDPFETMKEIKEAVSSGEDLDKIISKILSLLRKSFGAEKVGLIILEEAKKKAFASFGDFEKFRTKETTILANIDKSKGVLVYDEIIAKGVNKEDKFLNKGMELMKRIGVTVLCPLKTKGKLRGFMLIGPKKNKEAYTVQDIDLLENIASTLSVAVEKFIIITTDVNLALRNFSSPHLLKSSNLLRLKQVQKLSGEKSISKVDALKEIITSAIEYFKPEKDEKRRTAARLKYEILKMIAYEGATESQIMWDLGFDVYTRSVEEKLNQGEKPRFPLRSAGEYSATSDRSFKRLKKEAVEMVKWKVEEGEKN